MKIKKRKVLLMCFVICILVLLAGCEKSWPTYVILTYKGESEHWSAVYNMKGKMRFVEGADKRLGYEEDGHAEFYLRYKGPLSELSTVRNFKYSFEGAGNGSSSVLKLDEPLKEKTFTFKYPQINQIYGYNKDRVLKATVTWDGADGGEEIIEMKCQ